MNQFVRLAIPALALQVAASSAAAEKGRPNVLVILTDLLATLADLTGVKLPRWAAEDSFSMHPAWFGGRNPTRDHVVLQPTRVYCRFVLEERSRALD